MNPLLEKLLKEEEIFKPYTEEELIKLRLKDCTKNPDGTYSCDSDVDLSEMGLTELPVRFKEVKGNFNCSYNKLTTLKGAPEYIGGYFSCYENNLTTLEGAPEVVGGSFYCYGNNLTTLEGAPKEVGGSFYYYENSLPAEELKKTIDRSYL